METTRILILCIGNICRSPMATAVLADLLERDGSPATVQSAGLGALVGRPADPLACELMHERDLNIDAHRAQQFDASVAKDYDLILVMDEDQRRRVEARAPLCRGRVHLLGHWGGFDIGDPYRQPKAQFAASLALIERGCEGWRERFDAIFMAGPATDCG